MNAQTLYPLLPMKTNFSELQLADPLVAEADQILKTCQHFGFCTSGCPTYVLLHDENDGPRGRIDLIKEMLESDSAPSPKTVEHIDRCLSCMSCMTTCAVKVDYMHLVDTARVHIEKHYRRPFRQRAMRSLLGYVLPRPALFGLALRAGRAVRVFERLLPGSLRHMTRLIPKTVDQGDVVVPKRTVYPAEGKRKWRVALLAGCVQPVMSPHINAATIRLLTRLGCDVVIPKLAGCCGSLDLHMGKSDPARAFARANIMAWIEELDGEGLDSIITNASGCGTTVKDYAHLLKDDASVALLADRVAKLTMDISEWLAKLDLPDPPAPRHYRLAYHDACSLRNAQKVTSQPRKLLRKAGFSVQDVPEAHFCCGSAGTYNMLQPKIAKQLGERKAANIARTDPQIIAAGNIGCITQIGMYSGTPIVHTVELLDWAYGGPVPPVLRNVELTELLPEPVSTSIGDAEQIVVFVNNKADNNDVGIW
jgi:glycolate oxidase iron-sulfur subunit